MLVKRCVLALAIAIAPTTACYAVDQLFFGYLNGANESPNPVPSPGTGFALVTYSRDTVMMRVQVSFAGLTTGTSASHIHCCFSPPTTTTAAVATTTPYFTGFPIGVTAGTYDHTFDMTLASSYNPSFVTAQGSISAALNAILIGMTNSTAYFNIHTSMFQAGEIRANMKPDAVFVNGFEPAAG
jgi:putative alpha-1,2-mannosidase